MEKLTPAMQQYHEVKLKYKDHIVLFRMGDFYEIFFDDALEASKILNITLTARDKEKKIPMAGIPFHAISNYLPKLVKANKKVVLVEQIENPATAKGVVKRDIVKIFTPGTSMLDDDIRSLNYLIAVYIIKKQISYSYIDISEGKVYYSETSDINEMINFIQTLSPKEILINKKHSDHLHKLIEKFANIISPLESNSVNDKSYTKYIDYNLIEQVNDIKSVQMLLNYVITTQKTSISHINEITRIQSKGCFSLDPSTLKNLEIFQSNSGSTRTLINILDNCETSIGSRLLKSWLISPLTNIEEISKRLDSINFFYSAGQNTINDFKLIFSQTFDIQRIVSKVGLSTASPKDLRDLVESIKNVFHIQSNLKEYSTHKLFSLRLKEIQQQIESDINECQKVLANLDRCIEEEPPNNIREIGIIKKGVDDELDKLRNIKENSKDWLKNLEREEAKKTKIKNLKVKYNKVFGYYIEISKLYSNKVPDYYIRKQTLVNAERYVTPDLKEHESTIFSADDKIKQIENRIFLKLIDEVKSRIPFLQEIAYMVGEADIYLSNANLAISHDWQLPQFNDKDYYRIKESRHPVIEIILKKNGKDFIPNDINIEKGKKVSLITGPNMGGKSTYIRQCALLVLLAQVGFFIPCKKADISIVDNIFTRVGASDNLSEGQSTFMVEMIETAEILKRATEKSLIIFDEVGRGTSTFDGMSIAWAILEYLSKKNPPTLFATHYHELTEASNVYTNIKNLTVQVHEHNKEIIFLHKIANGKADKSYGIHVAKLAGIPKSVIKSSSQILKKLEKEKELLAPKPINIFESSTSQFTKEDNIKEEDKVITKLKELDINTITPIEALEILMELKNTAENSL